MNANPNRMIDHQQVMERLDVSKPTAYRIIRQLNEELRKMGCRTLQGKVNEAYFQQVFFSTPDSKKRW